MRQTTLWLGFLCACLTAAAGCEQPMAETTTRPAESTAATPAATPAVTSQPKEPMSDDRPAAAESQSLSTTQDSSSTKVPPQAEVTSIEPEVPAAPPAEPTTALSAMAAIDLETFPKLKVKQEFESHPLSIYYSGQGSVASADQFLMRELGKANWKETTHLVTSTDQYVDRLLTKDGYYLRLTVSTGGTPEEVAVNLTVLGNFDVRTLPKTSDAEDQESTFVMAGHKTRLSIAEAYQDLSQRMQAAGWQVVEDFQAPMADVPHYRSLRFRKNAMRVNLGLVKDPSNPGEKTNIFYHAESVMPIDVPMLDHRLPMKFDVASNRASVPWQGDRPALVKLLTEHAPKFGWTLINADDYVQDKTTVLYISHGSPVGIATRYIESGGAYYLSMERVKLPSKKEASAATPSETGLAESADSTDSATTSSSLAAEKMKSEIDAHFAQAESAVEQAVQDELSKALGSLSAGAGKADMRALQAQAAKLQAQFGALADQADTESKPQGSTPKTATSPTKVTDVPDDAEPISQADQAIQTTEAKIKLGEREMTLQHCLAYVRIEDDQPTKILLLSDKPLQADKLDKLCASGESFTIYDGFGNRRVNVALELRITGNSVMMNFSADSSSLSTNSSQLKSTVRQKNGQLRGRVTLSEPIELNQEALTFEIKIAEKIRK